MFGGGVGNVVIVVFGSNGFELFLFSHALSSLPPSFTSHAVCPCTVGTPRNVDVLVCCAFMLSFFSLSLFIVCAFNSIDRYGCKCYNMCSCSIYWSVCIRISLYMDVNAYLFVNFKLNSTFLAFSSVAVDLSLLSSACFFASSSNWTLFSASYFFLALYALFLLRLLLFQYKPFRQLIYIWQAIDVWFAIELDDFITKVLMPGHEHYRAKVVYIETHRIAIAINVINICRSK